jgi:hypothetical protein
MLTKINNPYRVIVSEIARKAGLDDRTFPTKKAAQNFVKKVRSFDPNFNPSLHVIFRFVDTATGELYTNRAEYELEQERCRQWRIHGTYK